MASGIRALYPGVSPQVALDELGASQTADGRHLGRQDQARRLDQWFRAGGLCVPKSALASGLVGAWAEHETYFDARTPVAVKVTHDGRFGHCLRDENEVSTPGEYLQRLAWHNELFGDDILIHGLLEDSAALRIVSSQPWINSLPSKLSPTQAEIDLFLAEFGFLRSGLYPHGFIYFNRASGLVIGDAQPANLLLDEQGVIRDFVHARSASIP